MSKKQMLLILALFAVLLFSFIVFGRILTIILIGVLIGISFGIKSIVVRLWGYLK